jgi:hypothetical protein
MDEITARCFNLYYSRDVVMRYWNIWGNKKCGLAYNILGRKYYVRTTARLKCSLHGRIGSLLQ